jgi:hypothetical protein
MSKSLTAAEIEEALMAGLCFHADNCTCRDPEHQSLVVRAFVEDLLKAVSQPQPIPEAEYSLNFTDMGLDYCDDDGVWRYRHLIASGNNRNELVESATIEEVDKDGETLKCYDLADASDVVSTRALEIIDAVFGDAGPTHVNYDRETFKIRRLTLPRVGDTLTLTHRRKESPPR